MHTIRNIVRIAATARLACIFALALWCLPAMSCICWPVPPDTLLSARTGLVLQGRVVGLEGTGVRGWAKGLPYSPTRVTVQVRKVWKGRASGEVVASYHAADGRNCGWTFRMGEEVVLVAILSPMGDYQVDECLMAAVNPYTASDAQRVAPYLAALDNYRARLDSLGIEGDRDPASLPERVPK